MSDIERTPALDAKRSLNAIIDWYEGSYLLDHVGDDADPRLARLITEAKRVLDALECDNELIE